MDAFDLLVAQHREVEELFKAISPERDAVARKALFVRLARALSLHSRLEEELVYPALRTVDTSDLLQHSLEDHAEVTAQLLQLAKLSPTEMEFDARLVALRAAVEAHISEEQSELFGQARDILGAAGLAALSEQVVARLEQLERPGELPVFESELTSIG